MPYYSYYYILGQLYKQVRYYKLLDIFLQTFKEAHNHGMLLQL